LAYYTSPSIRVCQVLGHHWIASDHAIAVIKNQLLHVYAKNYEGNAKLLIIRLVRYSFDGLMLAQVVFIAFMAIATKTANIVLGSLLLTFTLIAKLVYVLATCTSIYSSDTPIAPPGYVETSLNGMISLRQPQFVVTLLWLIGQDHHKGLLR
jgi:hypothetical protein